MRKLLLFLGGLAIVAGLASCSRDLLAAADDDEYSTWQSVMREADADSYEWELNYSE
ncbi:MAG: hypothetical protein J6X70_08025 [Muribaculaceae bacterium]|nr:hypothetical protein [Muribaculaceae bacterium]